MGGNVCTPASDACGVVVVACQANGVTSSRCKADRARGRFLIRNFAEHLYEVRAYNTQRKTARKRPSVQAHKVETSSFDGSNAPVVKRCGGECCSPLLIVAGCFPA